MSTKTEILSLLSEVAQEHNRSLPSLVDDLPILQSGLDSLCLAVTVARLEDRFGVDPFIADDVSFPVTLGDFVRIYEKALDGSHEVSTQ